MKCGLSELDYYCAGVVWRRREGGMARRGLRMQYEQHGKGEGKEKGVQEPII